MDFRRVRGTDWLRAVVVITVLGFLVERPAPPLHAQTSGQPQITETGECALRDVRSRHFLIHTDLLRNEADEFAERGEVLLAQISTYWGRPVRGVLECYVIRNLDGLPVSALHPEGARGVKTFGGVTLMALTREGKRQIAKSAVYASARLEVLQHEVVHAYCHQTFGRVGPVWYSEGMAEMGHYWREGDSAVHAAPREIEFLHNKPPKSLAKVLSPTQVTGDRWQNYAARWALCHFMFHNRNYSQQFRDLGRGLLAGKDVSFERTFASTASQLFFEYLLFLKHISFGYRVDLCAWDWEKKFHSLQPGRIHKVVIAAGRGWQPTGLSVRGGTQYDYLAQGTWQITGKPDAIDADGDDQRRGRLVGVLLKDHELGSEFELGVKGSLGLKADGNLYLRCRNAWNELAGDHGRVTVTFQVQGQGPLSREADGKGQSGPLADCSWAADTRQ